MRKYSNTDIVHPNKTRVIITGDYHIPFLDKDAYQIMKEFAKKYKPHKFIINGDLVDFYSLSAFDKNPLRKNTLGQELIEAKETLKDLRKTMSKTNIIYTEGNHERRTTKYLFKHPELMGLDLFNVRKLFDLDKLSIEYIGAKQDYWSRATGVYRIADIAIMHGDSRINNASYSKWGGYAAKNTVLGNMESCAMNHTHRLAEINISNGKYKNTIGLECGCLCNIPGGANWQQGFVTFEVYQGKYAKNFILHHIDEHGLSEKKYRIKIK